MSNTKHDGEFYWEKWASPESAISHKWVWDAILRLDTELSSFPIIGTRWIIGKVPEAIAKAEGTDLIENAWRSERLSLLIAFCEAAAVECIAKDLSDNSDQAESTFEEGISIYDSIEYADNGVADPYLANKDTNNEAQLDRKAQRLDEKVLKPFLSKDLNFELDRWPEYHTWHSGILALAVSKYIKSPFKSPKLDRFLLTVIVEAEAHTYLQSVMHEEILLTGRKSYYFQAVSEKSSRRYWRSEIFVRIILSIVIAVVVHPIWEALFFNENYDFLPWIISGLSLTYSFWFIPKTLDDFEHHRTKINLFDQLKYLARCQNILKRDGLLSISHLRNMFLESEVHQVEYVGALYALLDDIEIRGLTSV